MVGSCKLCGAPHSTCGPASTAVPVDQRIERRESIVGVKRYETTVNGTETILLLSDEDAKAVGLKVAAESKSAAKPANKSRTAQNKTK